VKQRIVVTALALAGAASAFAQQKLAVIDMQSALVQTRDGQKAVGELRDKYSPKDAEFQKRANDLQAKQAQYQKTSNTLSDTAKAAAEREIETMQRNLQRDSDDTRADMDQDQQRVLNDLGGKMMQVIQKYSADNQISMVFDVSQQPNNLLFATTAIDITRAIIELYDKTAPASSAPALSPVTAAPKTTTPIRPTTAAPATAPATTPVKPPATATPKPPPV
jgi:outer membrane protein